MKTEYDFIINPKARSGMGEMIWKALEPELKKQRIAYKVHMTQRRDHAEKIAESLTSDGRERTLVVLGRDGTVNEVVNGIRDIEKTTLGYIPIGSSNDFARGLGISKKPAEALNAVLHSGKSVHMDVGTLASTVGTRRFLVSGGMGFDAAVCHEVCVSRLKPLLNKLRLGKLSYAVVALNRLVKDRPVHMTLTLDDGRRMEFPKTYFAAFMNLKCEGGGFQFCPGASPEDGMLDVIVAHGLSVLKVLFLLPLAFRGKQEKVQRNHHPAMPECPGGSVSPACPAYGRRTGLPEAERSGGRHERAAEGDSRQNNIRNERFNKGFVNKVVVHFKSCYNRCGS